jgi:ribosome-binding protein aMBF1 (putative translation factor)
MSEEFSTESQGAALARRRRLMGWATVALARKMEVTERTVRRWEAEGFGLGISEKLDRLFAEHVD